MRSFLFHFSVLIIFNLCHTAFLAFSLMAESFNVSLPPCLSCYNVRIVLRGAFCLCLQEGGDVVQAIACYRKALVLRPNFPDAFANLVHSLVFVCDWSNRDKDFATLKEMLAAQVICRYFQVFFVFILPDGVTRLRLFHPVGILLPKSHDEENKKDMWKIIAKPQIGLEKTVTITQA